jgi:hypothetical protein
MTLKAIGRLTGEHEATVSRHLARARDAVRVDVERVLRTEAGLSDAEVSECLTAVTADAGTLDLANLFGESAARKTPRLDRSTEETS